MWESCHGCPSVHVMWVSVDYVSREMCVMPPIINTSYEKTYQTVPCQLYKPSHPLFILLAKSVFVLIKISIYEWAV